VFRVDSGRGAEAPLFHVITNSYVITDSGARNFQTGTQKIARCDGYHSISG